MATFDTTATFKANYARLTAQQQTQFRAAVADLVADLNRGDGKFTTRLRVRRVNRSATLWEMTWAANGRALFERPPSPLGPDHQHIRWVAIGGHEVFDNRRMR